MKTFRNILQPVVVSVLMLGIAAGCATDESVESTANTPTFGTEPFAPTPRLEIEWRRPIDVTEAGNYRPQQFAAPLVMRMADRQELIVGTDSGSLYRLRAGDGKERWAVELDGAIHATPVSSSKHIYVGTLTGTFYAIDRKTGEVDWKIENDRGIESSAAVGQNLVYFTTNAGRLVAVDSTEGEVAWTYSRSTPKEFTIKGSGTPVVAGASVYCGFTDGSLVAVGARTGDEKWVADISGGETEFTDVDEPVSLDRDRLYVTSYGAGVAAIDRETGELLWQRDLANVASTEYAEGTLYVAIASGRLLALDADDGSSKWGFKFSHNLPVELSASGSYLLVSTGGGPLYVIDRMSGYPLSRWNPSTGFNTAVTISSRAGYILSNRGYLYSFRLAF